MLVLVSTALRARDAIRGVWREAAKFGVVGALAFVVDNGGYNLLVFGLPGGTEGGVMGAAPCGPPSWRRPPRRSSAGRGTATGPTAAGIART
ncbi:hypothetical protein [Streptomyces stelliscabiei]|uniref:hypothetical protein n=1 Tax=Streptomyces stelliscabiei TaxID=146820 RepID=UPI002FF0B79F